MKLISSLAGRYAAYRFFHPARKKPHRTPDSFGISRWSSLEIRSSDGTRIACWYIPGSTNLLAAVGHPLGLSRSASLGQARVLADLGFSVLLFDHRSHGESQFDPSSKDLASRFTSDIFACIDWLIAEYGKSDYRMVLFGFSFSTFPSLYSATKRPEMIDAIICDSGPGLQLEVLCANFFKRVNLMKIPGIRTTEDAEQFVGSISQRVIDMLDAEWPPAPTDVDKSDIELRFLSGADDEIMTRAQVRSISELYINSEHYMFSGGHLESFKEDESQYRQIVLDLVNTISQKPKRVR